MDDSHLRADAPDTGRDGATLVDLSAYKPGGGYSPGRGGLQQFLWYLCSLAFFESGWLPISRIKPAILRLFGAKIGKGVVIKPRVRIKFPWRLSIGDHSWIGECVWIDNLAEVSIGSHACLSQGAYLCTGSHDAHSRGFELRTNPISVGDGAWAAARCLLLPGVRLGPNSMAAAGAVVIKNVDAGEIVGGNPAKPIGRRAPGDTGVEEKQPP